MLTAMCECEEFVRDMEDPNFCGVCGHHWMTHDEYGCSADAED